ncbi:DUF58 domain-containing protein [Mycetocola zhadangensis]|uniref:DUF58 domain-containing protein n=1 Tax=Mycetocola zhadangensis TaxID=1164595 RepID=UPI003A4D2B12
MLVTATVVLLAATAIDRREGLYLSAFLLLLFAGSVVYVQAHKPRLSAVRSFSPSSVMVGEPATVRTRVQSKTDLDTIALWSEQVPFVFGRQPRGELPQGRWVRGRGYATDLEYELRSGHRGRYPIGPLWVTHGDPFGLVQAERAIAGTREISITPRVTILPNAGLRDASGDGVRHELNHFAVQRADELIAREYRTGDSLRRVHWRQTARRGELMVRQEERQGDPEAALLLDTSIAARGSASGATSEAHFERMVELAASLGVHLLEAGYQVWLIETVTDAVPTVAGTTPFTISHFEPGAASALLDTLAETRQRPVPADYDVTAGLGPVIRRTGTVLPVFAVLGQVSPLGARRLAGMKINADPAVAFFVPAEHRGSDEPIDVQSLGDAGWRTALFSEHTPVSEAWSRAAFGTAAEQPRERGRGRVRN